MVKLFIDGGPLMWPLLACAIAAVAVAFERLVVLHRVPTAKKADQELETIETALREGGLEKCAEVISKGKGLLNYIFAHLLRRYDTLVIEKRDLDKARGITKTERVEADTGTQFLIKQAEMSEIRDELHITIDETTRTYVTRYLSVMNSVATISPLLGLLGTVFGMIIAFNSIAASGTGDPRVVAAGIAQALITTAAGLSIAVPTMVLYRYLGHRAEIARSSVEVYALIFSNTLLALIEKE